MITIKFPMEYLPSSIILDKKLKCKAYSFASNKSNKYGRIKAIDQKTEYATCEFDAEYEINGYYFGVSYSKNA